MQQFNTELFAQSFVLFFIYVVFARLIFIVICPRLLITLTHYPSYTDQELLQLLTQSDVCAFDTLYASHWETMYKNAYFILRDHDAAKDIVQDIFIWLWEHREKLKIDSLKSYLKAAVRFKVSNYIRSGNIRRSFFDEVAKFIPSSLPPTAEEITEIKALNAIVEEAVTNLPPKCRQIYKLNREEQLSNQEIATRLCISVKTVENQMTIALRRIRNSVEPYMVEFMVAALVYCNNCEIPASTI